MTGMNSKSAERIFDKEYAHWENIHNFVSKNDVVALEVYKRKEFVITFLKKNCLSIDGLKILEVGCGRGQNLSEFVKLNTSWSGVGVDISKNMISSCKSDYSGNKRLNFKKLNIEKEYLNDKFDVIVLLGVVGYFGSSKSAFINLNKMLKKNAYLIFTFGNSSSIFRMFTGFGISLLSVPIVNWFLLILLKLFYGKGNDLLKKDYFKSYSLKDIRSFLPKTIVLKKFVGLVFTSGFFGFLSRFQSMILGYFFSRNDPLNIAYSKIVVAKKK